MKIFAIATLALLAACTDGGSKPEPQPDPLPVERTCVVEFDTNGSAVVCTCTVGTETTPCPNWSMGQEFPAPVSIPDLTGAKP